MERKLRTYQADERPYRRAQRKAQKNGISLSAAIERFVLAYASEVIKHSTVEKFPEIKRKKKAK